MLAYYNEIDPGAAAWLRQLIAEGHVAPGVVDERDIRDVNPGDLRGFKQCHFFAGIGVWSYALRLAGWPDDKPVWTGSCPCQPFSSAGRGDGFADERHLWPAWFHLIQARRPEFLFGEQVASSDGLAWLDLVQDDLENANYSSGAIDLCAAGVGAPHIRQRLWLFAREGWLANSRGHGDRQHARELPRDEIQHALWPSASRHAPEFSRPARSLADDDGSRLEGRRGFAQDERKAAAVRGQPSSLADASGEQRNPRRLGAKGDESGEERGSSRLRAPGELPAEGNRELPGPVNGHWRDADWLRCRDGKWRPVESGSFPLANGAPARMVRLRGYGNAIVAQAAAEVIKAMMHVEGL